MTLSLVFAAAVAAGVAAPDLTPLKSVQTNSGEIVWIDGGKAAFPIVADRRDLESNLAALFLQSCVEDMTGVKVPIVLKAKTPVYVKMDRYTPLSGEFTVEIGTNGVALSGNGPYAAYDFAERVLGVRQYFDPKDGGRSVIKTDRLVLPFVKWSDAPVYLRREMHPAQLPWTRHYKKGNQLQHAHTVHVPRWVNDKTDFDYIHTRPEIFELRANGKRGVSQMLCYGNPKTLETYVERIDEELAGGRKSGKIVMPNSKTINVSQDDAGLACQCEYCKKFIDPALGKGGKYGPILWKHFVPALSDIAKKKWPEYTISILPYHNTCLCPDDLRLTNGNVEATLVTHPGLALLKDPRVKAEEEAKMRKWQKATGRKIVNWHYLIYPATFTSAPYLFGDAIVAHYRDVTDCVAGTYVDQYSMKRKGHELDLYLWFKALWNPWIVPDAVYDGFAERMYGPAAKEVREVIRLLTEGWKRPWKVPVVSMKNVFGTSYPVAETRRMRELLDKAKVKVEASGDEMMKRRFAFQSAQFERFFEDGEEYASGGAFVPLEVMKTTERPKVDGVLNDAAWTSAKGAAFVEAMNADRKLVTPPDPTEMRAVWTPGEGVTFGFKFSESQMDKVQRSKPPCVGNDQVELFLDPSGEGNGGYLQIALDAAGGRMFYTSRRGAMEWHGEGVETAVSEGPDHWSAEIFVPFSSIREFPGARIPNMGAVNLYWIGNSTRMRYGAVQDPRGYFSRLFTKFNWWNNHAAAFGRFMFKEW